MVKGKALETAARIRDAVGTGVEIFIDGQPGQIDGHTLSHWVV
jgi:hypothetical protein